VSSTEVREIAAVLKAIHASEAAREKGARMVEKLRALITWRITVPPDGGGLWHLEFDPAIRTLQSVN
jgi:hypothetical protein